MSDDKLKHKPQTKHTLSEVLKSLQDLIRNDLVAAKTEAAPAPSLAVRPRASAPPAHEADSLNDALDRLDNTITHNVIEPVERARETPPEPLLPDEDIEIEWEHDANSAATETIEAAPPPADETIELPSLEPEVSDVEMKSADADDSASNAIEVELAPPPPEPEAEPARADDVVERPRASEPTGNPTPKVSGAQEQFPFTEPSTGDDAPALDLASVDASSLEEMTLTIEAPELESANAPAETSEPETREAAAAEPDVHDGHNVSPTRARAPEPAPERRAPTTPAGEDKRAATGSGDPNVIEWVPPSFAKAAAEKTSTPKTADAPKPPSPARPANADTSRVKSANLSTSAPPAVAQRPAAATPTNKAAPPETSKRAAEPPRTAQPTPPQPIPKQPATKPAAPKTTEAKPPSPVEQAIKQAVPSKPTPPRPEQRPARPPLSPAKPPDPGAAKAANAPKRPDPVKPAANKPPATKPAAPEQTEIPVLKEIAELAAMSSGPLPEPGQARDIAIRVIARLNIERRKAGETPLDIKTIERLQQYLAEALAKRALNQPK